MVVIMRIGDFEYQKIEFYVSVEFVENIHGC